MVNWRGLEADYSDEELLVMAELRRDGDTAMLALIHDAKASLDGRLTDEEPRRDPVLDLTGWTQAPRRDPEVTYTSRRRAPAQVEGQGSFL